MMPDRLRTRLRLMLPYAAFVLLALVLGGVLSISARAVQAKQQPAVRPAPTAQPTLLLDSTASSTVNGEARAAKATATPTADLAQRPPIPALPTGRSIFAAGIAARGVAEAAGTQAAQANADAANGDVEIARTALRSPLAMPPAAALSAATASEAAAQPTEVDIWSILPTLTPTPPSAAGQAPIAQLLSEPLPDVAQPAPDAALAPAPAAMPAAHNWEPTPDGVARTVQVPILMYHYLSTPPADANIYRQDLSVSPELFAAHLDAMLDNGYTAISLDQLLAHLTQGAELPVKPVVITFDDGYRDNYENAFPLLRQRNMTATFFVVTDFVDGQQPDYFTWDMLREMAAGGMSIESHGRNHVSLRGKDDDYLVWQALGSTETIEHELGVRPRFVSYPAGEYDDNTIDIFRSANYWAGLTTVQGATHSSEDLFRLTRVRVRGTTTPEELLRLLALDW